MSLLFESMEKCVFLDKKRVSDGEGGYTVEWKEGAEFQAAITFDTSMEARTAKKAGVTSMYIVSTLKNVVLEYHDVFKRVEDNKIFRVTSDGDDKRTPNHATFQVAQVTAEEYMLEVVTA